MRIHYFQHVPFEGLGMIAEWAAQRGHSLSSTRFFEAGAQLPALSDYDALVVMGGPMGVYDEQEYPWLKEELAHLREAVGAGKRVLGICLGAQLIAAALGARVAPHVHKEIGWFPVALTDSAHGHPLCRGLNSAMTVLHWHGDRFEIPSDAVLLMSSAACDNQAFAIGSTVLALQFHLEMNAASVAAIVDACAHELVGGPHIQARETLLAARPAAAARAALFTLLDNWAA